MPNQDVRNELKEILRAAQLEVSIAVSRIDKADEVELASLAGAAHNLAAFVDFNSGCGSERAALESNPAAFVDFNDGCGGSVAATPYQNCSWPAMQPAKAAISWPGLLAQSNQS